MWVTQAFAWLKPNELYNTVSLHFTIYKIYVIFLIIEKGSHANEIVQKDLHLVVFIPHYSMAMFFE